VLLDSCLRAAAVVACCKSIFDVTTDASQYQTWSSIPTVYAFQGTDYGGAYREIGYKPYIWISFFEAAPLISISNAPPVIEGAATGPYFATFTVTLSSASQDTITVNYATQNGTAIAGTDYTAESGTVTFAPGKTTATITVPVTQETSADPEKTFSVVLSNPADTAGGPTPTLAKATGTATIELDGGFDTNQSVEQIKAGRSGQLNLAPDVYTIVIHRNANGSGSIQEFKDGVAVPNTFVGDLNLQSQNPAQMYAKTHPFAWDDLTPIAAGTYNAFVRTDAKGSLTYGTGQDIDLFNISGAPTRTDVEIHAGNGTVDSNGCFVVGNRNLPNFVTPIVNSCMAAGIAAQSTSGLQALGTVGLATQPGEMMLPTILPSANADQNGNLLAGPFLWDSAVQVQIVDDQTITQPTISFGAIHRLTTSGGYDLLAVDVNISHAVSKDLRIGLEFASGSGIIVTTSGDSEHDAGTVIATGTTRGLAIIRVPQNWTQFSLNVSKPK
jgi:Calx-beta domain/Family of unknown function (DUF5675)